MDELDLHIYPDDSARQDDDTHYAWPQIGPGDLGRVKQAVWDAFSGTGQPVVQEPGASGPFLKLRIGEIGWQVGVIPALRGLYTSEENVAVTDEARQARVYSAVVKTRCGSRTGGRRPGGGRRRVGRAGCRPTERSDRRGRAAHR